MAVRGPATEWVRVQMYRRMTPAERMELAAQMYDDAIAPAEFEYEVRRRTPFGVPRGLAELTEPIRRAHGRDGA